MQLQPPATTDTIMHEWSCLPGLVAILSSASNSREHLQLPHHCKQQLIQQLLQQQCCNRHPNQATWTHPNTAAHRYTAFLIMTAVTLVTADCFPQGCEPTSKTTMQLRYLDISLIDIDAPVPKTGNLPNNPRRACPGGACTCTNIPHDWMTANQLI